jgi:hypothetical protein
MFSIVPYQLTTLVPPWFLDPIKGSRLVKKCFENLLSDAVLGYEPSLGGVLLAYGNVRLPPNAVTLVDYTPFGRATCYVKVLLLKLSPGQRLIGRVVFVGEDQISLRVFGVFSAVITVDNGLSDYGVVVDAHQRAVGGQSVQGQETSSKQATKNNKIGLGSWLRFEVLRVQLGASERLFLLHGTLKDNAANSDQSVERLGLLEEDQVAEWFTLPSHPAYSAKLPTKRKQRRSSVNTLKESDKETDIFTFEASCFGDPFENDGARPAIHQYFAQEDSSEEEQEDKTTQPISSSPMESLSLKRRHKKKHSKKKKKKHDKKRKKEKRKREESSSEKKKRHKKKRKVSS